MKSKFNKIAFICSFLFFGLSLSDVSVAQNEKVDLKNIIRISFAKAESVVSEPVRDSLIHTVEIKINSDAKFKDPIEVVTEVQKNSSAIQADYKLLEDKIVFSNSIRKGVIRIQVNSDTNAEQDEVIILKIKESEKYLLDNPKEYKLTIKNDLLLPDPASLSIGTNFDFLDGVRTNNLYYDLNINFLSLSDNGNLNLIGLESGIKQNRTIAVDSTGIESFFTFGPVVDTSQRDSIHIRYKNDIIKTQIDYLSLYLNPSIRMNSKLTTNNFYTGFYTEVLRTKYISDYTRREPGVILPNTSNISTYPSPPNPIKTTITQVNWGPSVQYYHLSNKIKFHIKGVFGWSYTNDSNKLRFNAGSTGNFYIVNFDVTERKNLVSLGGEIRGDNLGSPYPLDIKSPTISIYLAKKFSLEKLADFITK